MLFKIMITICLVVANVESGSIVKRSSNQIMDGAEMKRYAKFLANKFHNEDSKLQQLGRDLARNLREVTEISDDVHESEKHMLNEIEEELNDVIRRNSRLKEDLKTLARLTSKQCGELVVQLRQLGSGRQLSTYKRIMDKMATLLKKSVDVLKHATREIEIMSKDMSKVMAPMGLFKGMIKHVKEEVDKRDNMQSWSQGVILPVWKILQHTVFPGGLLNDGKGDGGLDDAMEALVQDLPLALKVGESITRIVSAPHLVEKLNVIYHNFAQTQVELEEEKRSIEEERIEIFRWKTEVNAVRITYGANLEDLRGNMNDLVDLVEIVKEDFQVLKNEADNFLYHN